MEKVGNRAKLKSGSVPLFSGIFMQVEMGAGNICLDCFFAKQEVGFQDKHRKGILRENKKSQDRGEGKFPVYFLLKCDLY